MTALRTVHRFILRDGKIFSTAISPPADDVLAIKDDEKHVIAYCFMTDESEDAFIRTVRGDWDERFIWKNWT